MKSRLYYAAPIDGGKDKDPLGVLVIESTEPERWSRGDLEGAANDRFLGELSLLVELLARWVQKQSVARKEGY